MNRTRVIERVIFIVSFFIMISSLTVFADDHVHDWYVDYTEKVPYNQDQHKEVVHYYCWDCDEKKEEVSGYEDHEWHYCDYKKISDKEHSYLIRCDGCGATKQAKEEHFWNREEYNQISDKEHSITEKCPACGVTRLVKEKHNWKREECKRVSDKEHSYSDYCFDCAGSRAGKENHHFDPYHYCKECYEIVGRTILLTPGKWTPVNEKDWLRINVAKTGYITININEAERIASDEDAVNEDVELTWSLYNSAKKVYKGSKELYSNECVPVKKGIYYVKTDAICRIKYSFTKDPSKKNYTKKKAVKLKKKKRVVTVMFSNAKKKTWKRYYKIKLNKKQFLHLTIAEGHVLGNDIISDIDKEKKSGLRVTNSDNEKVRMKYGWGANENFYVSSKKLEKGTYYICLSDSWSKAAKARSTGSVYSLSWK